MWIDQVYSARHISDPLSGTWVTKKIILVALYATKFISLLAPNLKSLNMLGWKTSEI